MAQATRPVMLVILDGFGWREEAADNAVRQAKTPHFDRLWSTCPHTFLRTSGLDVGLPAGQMGNSEVGHTNIGARARGDAGMPRIGQAIEDGSLAANKALGELIKTLRVSGGACHLMGLVSPGGVHSHQDHAVALAGILHDAGIPVIVHAFTDGRDTPPRSADGDLARLVAALPKDARVATVSGRYFAMDRDNRWDRVKLAYDAIAAGSGPRGHDPAAVIHAAYEKNVTDEFIPPTVIGDYDGMHDGDAVLCFNFRADRVREILAALLDPGFAGFARSRVVKLAGAAGMARYSDALAPISERAVSAAEPGAYPGRDRRRGRTPAIAHGRDREIPPRHLLPEWRARAALRWRGSHHGALAQGRDLRSATLHVGARIDREGRGGHRLGEIRI